MFRDAKVGDRVWSVGNGWGTITEIRDGQTYPLVVAYDNAGALHPPEAITYTTDGKIYDDDLYPSLFWSEIKIVPPPKPKRKVKKVIEGWINIYKDPDIEMIRHATSELADFLAHSTRLGPAHFFRHEYEAEE